MSQLLARIMLAIFMLPCAGVLYVATIVCIEQSRWFGYPFRKYGLWIFAGLVAWMFIAAYWTLLWRSSVRPTARRLRMTAGATGIAAAAGCLFGLVMDRLEDDISAWFGSVAAPLVWLILTTLAWRETADERAARVSGASTLTCPTCGYNLTGLQSTRCPECGTQFTLDELVSQQKGTKEREFI
jgi:hypothetical protein